MLTDERTTPQTPTSAVAPPSGTVQNDDYIASHAMSELERANLLPGLRVKLSVDHGWLTISGDAAHKVERSAAECVVRYVPGVRGVTNRLVVTRAERR